jgi:hypothetical protein
MKGGKGEREKGSREPEVNPARSLSPLRPPFPLLPFSLSPALNVTLSYLVSSRTTKHSR